MRAFLQHEAYHLTDGVQLYATSFSKEEGVTSFIDDEFAVLEEDLDVFLLAAPQRGKNHIQPCNN